MRATLGAPIRVDALVELGRYDEAERELQAMIDRKPNLAAYARVSYLRELQRRPRRAPRARCASPSPPAGRRRRTTPTCSALLGRAGAPPRPRARPRRAFGAALALVPRLRARRGGRRWRGSTRRATRGLERRSAGCAASTERLPLARVRHRARRDRARRRAHGRRPRDLALVAAEQQLQRAAGVDIDVELAVFEADHGSPAKAVALARRGWDAAPSVRAADALGWALTRSGEPRAGLRWAAARWSSARSTRSGAPTPASRRSPPGRRGGAAAAADRARARPRRLSRGRRGGRVARCGDPRRRSGAIRDHDRRAPSCPPSSTPCARTACASRPPPVGARGADRCGGAADRGGARGRRGPRLDVPQPGDAGDDRDRPPRASRTRSRPLRARAAAAPAGRPARAAGLDPAALARAAGDPPRRARGAGFEAAFTHFPIVGRCSDCSAPNLSRR